MKKYLLKNIIKILTVLLSFLMSFNLVWAEGDSSTYDTNKGSEWQKNSDGSWTKDIDGDGETDVTMVSSKDSNGNTIWTYTFNVKDDKQKYYVYEKMNGDNVQSNGLAHNFSSIGSDGKSALERDPGTVDAKTHSYTITNSYNTGTLKLTKIVDGDMGNDDPSFTFSIQLYGHNLNGIKNIGGYIFKNGTATVKLKKDQSILIAGIPADTYYTITEAPISGYEVENKENGNDEGEIIANTVTESVWVNKTVSDDRPDDPDQPSQTGYGSWKLSKTVTGSQTSGDKSYKFLASLKHLEANKKYEILTDITGKEEKQSYRSDSNGNADVNVELKKNETIQFKDVPVGSTYQVMEHKGKNYISSYEITDSENKDTIASRNGANTAVNTELSTAEETVDDGEDVTVTFTNDYPSVQSLLISDHWLKLDKGKLVDDNEKPKEFEVTVHFSKIPQGTVIDSPEVGTVTPDMYGEADKTFTMSTNTSDGKNLIHFTGIPAGVTYQITQAKGNKDYPAYRPSYAISANDSAGNPIDGFKTITGSGNLSSEISTGEQTISDGQNHEVRLENVPAINFGIVKSDQEKKDKKLEGATYELSRYEDGKNKSVGSQTTDSDGFDGWGTITDGIYILKETAAPKGYAVGDDIVFKIEDGKAYYCTSTDSLKDAEKVADGEALKEWKPLDQKYQKTDNYGNELDYYPYSVTEGMLINLPMTGGIGLYVTLMIAAGLIAAGFLINHKGKGKKTVAILLLAAMTVGTVGIHTTPAHAENEPETYSLNVQYSVGNTKVSGANFSIVKVADLDVSKQKYTLVDPFKRVNADFSNNTAENYSELARKFKDTVGSDTPVTGNNTTDADGKTSFNNLSPGMYLLWQTRKSGVAESYKDAIPALVSVPNYDSEKNEFVSPTVNVKSESDVVTAKGVKQWIGDQENQRPDSVTLHLTEKNSDGNDEDVPGVNPVTVTKDNGWKFSFGKVKKLDENGKEIKYGVREDPVDGYTSSVSGDVQNGFTVTNTYTPETVNVSGQKIWKDTDESRRPSEITVTVTGMKTDGSVIQKSQKVTAQNNWSYSFDRLPKYDQGNIIPYAVSETEIDGKSVEQNGKYVPAVSEDGKSITNTPVKKDETAPVTLTVLKKDAEAKGILSGASFEITEDGSDQKIQGITNENGQLTLNLKKEGTYTLKETKAPEGYTIPSSLRDGLQFQVKKDTGNTELEVKENNGFLSQISHLFSREEKGGYAYHYVKNTRQGFLEVQDDPEVKDITAEKVWDDNNNQDHERSDVILHLNRTVNGNTSEVSSRTISADAKEKDLKVTWANQPLYINGQKVTYSVSEDPVNGYVSRITGDVESGFIVTNTHTPRTVDVTGTKVWNDADSVGKDGYTRPSDIEVTLTGTAEGKPVHTDVQTISEDTGWSYGFRNLPKYDDGKEITYTVSETTIGNRTPEKSSYISEVLQDGRTIQNTPRKEENPSNGSEETGNTPVTLTIVKRDGRSERNGVLTDAVFEIQKDGSDQKDVRTTDEKGQTTLSLKDSGSYHLRETKAPEGYSIPETMQKGLTLAVTKSEKNGLSLNVSDGKKSDHSSYVFSYDQEKHTGILEVHDDPLTEDIKAEKVWKDHNNQKKARKDVVLHLKKTVDGVTTEVSSRVIKADASGNDLKVSWKNVPVYQDGKKVSYSVTEDPMPDYRAEITGNETDGFTVNNTYVHSSENPSSSDSSQPNTSDQNNIPLTAGILGGSVIVLFSILMFRRRYN